MKKLNNLKCNKILVIGDIMIDRYYKGNITRISPEAPVPIFEKKDEYIVLGGAANTASNLIAAKQIVSVASVIGEDIESNLLLNLLKNKDISTNLIIKDSSRRTTVKTRILGQNNQQMFRIDVENKELLDDALESAFLNKILPHISKYSIIILSDYMKGVLTQNITTTIIKTARNLNIKVLIDVKDTNSEKYKGAFLIKPNLTELYALTGLPIKSSEDVIAASKYLRKICDSDFVLTTQGEEGMTLVDREDTAWHVDCISKEVYDVTGAGDTVIAYLGVGLANNFSVLDSVILSNYAAGIKVLKAGTAEVSIEEVKKYISKAEKNYDISKDISKIVKLDRLIKNLHIQKNKKIVFTNGCFDILHRGHLYYLKEASKLGDIFIIGVNSDNSIRRLKGDFRPIVGENDRMSMLAALEFIDYVIKFDEDTPLNLIEAIQPDILVKGGDYLSHKVIGKEIVEAKGGELVLIPFVDGQSTTDIINKILEVYTTAERSII